MFNLNDDKKTFGTSLMYACNILNLSFSYEIFNNIFLEKKRHHHNEDIPDKYLKAYDGLLEISLQ
jgi:hypothetical protein